MRFMLAMNCLLAVPAATALAQPQPPARINPVGGTGTVAVVGIGSESSVDQVLDALDAAGKGLKDFSADVELADANPITLNETSQIGKIWFQNKPDGNARIHVVFDKLKLTNKVLPEKTEYLLDGGTLVDRNYPKKQEVQRQIVKPGEKLNPLKLGEGPFPLPLGQSKEEVHKQFDVKKAPPSKEDPSGTVHLTLTPRPGTRYARKIKTMDLWVDPQTNMPVRIETLDSNESSVHTTTLSNLKRNTGLTDADFALPKIGKDWSQRLEQLAE